MENGESVNLFTLDNTTNEYVPYETPAQPAFKETLPDDIRESEHLSDIEDVSQLAGNYVNLKKNYEPAPESSDAYVFEKPEGYEVSEEKLSEFKKIAHEEGITQKQFSRLIQVDFENRKQADELIKKSILDRQAKAEAELKTEWGNDYDKKLQSAKAILNHEKLVDDGFKQFLENTRFGDHPQVAKFFAKVAEFISEDTFNAPGNGGGPQDPVKLGVDGRPMLKFPSMEES